MMTVGLEVHRSFVWCTTRCWPRRTSSRSPSPMPAAGP